MVMAESLRDEYEKVCRALEGAKWRVRLGVSRVLERLDCLFSNGENGVVFMEYPAGYGKSAMTLALAKVAVDGNPFFSRVIHVLPMRTIADDLGGRLRKWMEKLGYYPGVVGIQHMGSPGSPFFAKKCVVVTLDTFMLNFYKAPACELAKLFKYDVSHYEFPRGNIYSSLVVFDEFHLLQPSSTGDFPSFDDEAKALYAATRAIIQMASVGVPTVVMTATMPRALKDFLRRQVESFGLKFEEEAYSPEKDPQFEEERRRKRIKLTVWEGGVLDAAVGYCGQGKRVLIVLNTVKAAVEVYRELRSRGVNSVLLHGRLPESVKRERAKELGRAKTLVATQVVEAGIDESFDVLVTEVCPPDRLLQRMGRVARKEEHYEGEVVVVKQVSSGVYDKNVIDATWRLIEGHDDFRPRSKVEDEVRAVMGEVYCEERVGKLDQQFEVFGRLLGDLDAYPFLTAQDARRLIEAVGGLTASFGIVSAFAAEDVNNGSYLQNAVGLSENMARKAIMHGANVVKDGRIEALDERSRRALLRANNLSLELLRNNYEGIVLDEIDREVGYVGVSD